MLTYQIGTTPPPQGVTIWYTFMAMFSEIQKPNHRVPRAEILQTKDEKFSFREIYWCHNGECLLYKKSYEGTTMLFCHTLLCNISGGRYLILWTPSTSSYAITLKAYSKVTKHGYHSIASPIITPYSRRSLSAHPQMLFWKANSCSNLLYVISPLIQRTSFCR